MNNDEKLPKIHETDADLDRNMAIGTALERAREEALYEKSLAEVSGVVLLREVSSMPRVVREIVVIKNSWWFQNCPKHGETEHQSYLGGKCVECRIEAIEREDYLKKEMELEMKKSELNERINTLADRLLQLRMKEDRVYSEAEVKQTELELHSVGLEVAALAKKKGHL